MDRSALYAPTRAHLTVLCVLLADAVAAQLQIDPAYAPQLQQQVTHVREVMPIHDGRTVIVEHWPGGPGEAQFYNELACLQSSGERDFGYAALSNVITLVPWNDGAFYLWQLNYPNYILRRHVASGANDPGYQISTTAWPGDYRIDDLQQVNADAQGRVYLVGSIKLLNSDGEVVSIRQVVRLDLNGALDPTFTPGLAPYLNAAFPLPDGRVLLSGSQSSYNGVPVPRVFVVHADGSLDTSFSTGFWTAHTTSVLPMPDGGLIATGRFINFISLVELDTSFVVKLLPNGSQDPEFDHDLRLFETWNSGAYTRAYSIVEWGDDHYLISGDFDEVNGYPRRGMAMIDRHGALVLDQCDWPGPGTVEGRVFLRLVKDGDDAVFAYGTFNGFNDGVTVRNTKGLVRFVRGTVDVSERTSLRAPDIALYPVPAKDRVFIHYLGWVEGDRADVTLLDAAGRVLRQWRPRITADLREQIDLRSLSPGTYQVRVVMGSGVAVNRKFLLVP
jgi:hypothetical protein